MTVGEDTGHPVLPDFGKMSSGCAVIAIDLGTRKQLRWTAFKGLGPIEHFKYFNAIALDVDDGAIRVDTMQNPGRSIEFVDRESGKTPGQKVFPKD